MGKSIRATNPLRNLFIHLISIDIHSLTHTLSLYPRHCPLIAVSMAKRKRDSEPPDTPSIIVSNATSTTTPTKPSKMPCRHMYTNEEHRFIWYHRKTLGMSPNKTHGKFHDYFKPAVRVSLDGLNQLVGRLGRTLPDDVVGVVNTEAWATSGPVGMNEEVFATLPKSFYRFNNNVQSL